ncbi:hypothetical protein DFH27DRAFT_641453 [Peziza echinospora]|nr:hypothetical protein DFH27DRAFT_641453 [Peziza echinospora]
MPRASTPRLAPGFTLPTRRTFILPGSEPITDARHLLDQTNEYVVRALNSSYPASIQPTNRTHHLHGYNTRSWFLSTGTWSSHRFIKQYFQVPPSMPHDASPPCLLSGALAESHDQGLTDDEHETSDTTNSRTPAAIGPCVIEFVNLSAAIATDTVHKTNSASAAATANTAAELLPKPGQVIATEIRSPLGIFARGFVYPTSLHARLSGGIGKSESTTRCTVLPSVTAIQSQLAEQYEEVERQKENATTLQTEDDPITNPKIAFKGGFQTADIAKISKRWWNDNVTRLRKQFKTWNRRANIPLRMVEPDRSKNAYKVGVNEANGVLVKLCGGHGRRHRKGILKTYQFYESSLWQGRATGGNISQKAWPRATRTGSPCIKGSCTPPNITITMPTHTQEHDPAAWGLQGSKQRNKDGSIDFLARIRTTQH